VNSAARELRRNYSKKVADKLAFLTKTSLKVLSKHFASASMDLKTEEGMDEASVKNIVFVLTAYLRYSLNNFYEIYGERGLYWERLKLWFRV
jgi:hypothetical protein